MACDVVAIIRVVVSIAAAVPAVISCASPRWVSYPVPVGNDDGAGLWTNSILDTPSEVQWVQKMFVGGLICTAGGLVSAIGAMVLVNNQKYREKCIYSGAAFGLLGGFCYMIGFAIFTHFINNVYPIVSEFDVGYIMCIISWLLHWLVFLVFIVPQCREDD